MVARRNAKRASDVASAGDVGASPRRIIGGPVDEPDIGVHADRPVIGGVDSSRAGQRAPKEGSHCVAGLTQSNFAPARAGQEGERQRPHGEELEH